MKIKLFCVAAALLTMVAGANTAEARRYDGVSASSEYSHRASRSHRSYHRSARSGRKYRHRQHSRRSYHGRRVASSRANGRPAKWCGWYMRQRRGGGPEFNRAWHWRNYGSASGPQIGAVVVWRHHVGEITGRAANGRWIVRSGNDGGRVRERARSVAGAVFRVG